MSGDGGRGPDFDDNGGKDPGDDHDQPVSFQNWMKLHLFQYEKLKRMSKGNCLDWDEDLEIGN